MTCKKCARDLPPEGFYVDSRTGRSTLPCKDCRRAYSRSRAAVVRTPGRLEYEREYRKQNRDKLRSKAGDERAQHPERVRERARRWAASERGQAAALRSRCAGYGITTEHLEQMTAAQGDSCAICQRKRPLIIDHDHESGKVRGLLCRSCNSALGQFGDSAAGVKRALAYLGKTR